MQDYSYDELLRRAFLHIVPPPRLELPPPIIWRRGHHTCIQNFAAICSRLARDPMHVAAGLGAELGVTVSVRWENAGCPNAFFFSDSCCTH